MLLEKPPLFSTRTLLVSAMLLLALLVGVALPGYVGAMGDSIAKLMVLPALILLLLLLCYDRMLLLLLILVLRASGDVFLESTKFSLGSVQLGIGGLINACVLLIALLLMLENPKVLHRKMLLPWLGFLMIALYGVVSAPQLGDAIRTYLSLISYTAIFVSAFYFVRSPTDFRRVAVLIIWSSILPVLYGALDIVLQGGVHGPNGARLQSTFSHPNIFAFYLTLVIALVLYLLKSPEKNHSAPRSILNQARSSIGDTAHPTSSTTGVRVMLMLYALILLVFLLLTQTRSAWIGCFALFALYGWFFERRYLVYLFLIPLLALLLPSVRERLMDLGSGNEVVQYAKLNSFAWRVYIWESGLQWMRASSYFLGNGLGAFQYYSPTFFPLAGKVHFGAHNIYVQWLFELGVLGLLAYLWLFVRLLWMLRSFVAYNRLGGFIVIALMIQYLVVSFSDNMAYYLVFNWYFWFVVGAACASLCAAQSSAQAMQPPNRQSPQNALDLKRYSP